MVPQGVVELSGDAKALPARSPERFLLSDADRFGRSFPPDADGFGCPQHHEEPGGQRCQRDEGRGRPVPEEKVRPREDDEPGRRGDRGGRPVPLNDGGEVRDEEGEPDGAIRVPEHEVGERRPEDQNHDGHGMTARAASGPAARMNKATAPMSKGRRADCCCEAKYVPTVKRAPSPTARSPPAPALHRAQDDVPPTPERVAPPPRDFVPGSTLGCSSDASGTQPSCTGGPRAG